MTSRTHQYLIFLPGMKGQLNNNIGNIQGQNIINMTQTILEDIFARLKTQSLSIDVGDKIFKQGESVSNIYYIKTGKIQLIRNTIDGTPVILHIGHQGETIAEASLFSSTYHCSAVAYSASNVLSVKKLELLNFLENNPEAMMGLLAVFSRQVRDLRALNEIKNIRSAKERILSFIKYNANENKEMSFRTSLKGIAHEIGLAHETFYRELKKLEDSGKLERTTDLIKLL